MRARTRRSFAGVAVALAALAAAGPARAQTAPAQKGSPIAPAPDTPSKPVAEPEYPVPPPPEPPYPPFVPDDVSYDGGRAPMRVGPGLRVGPGFGVLLRDEVRAVFNLDVVASGRIGLHRGDTQWVVVPELGYAWRTPESAHQLSAGVGIGRGEGDSAPLADARSVFGGFCYVPRAVVELGRGEPAGGFRHGVSWDGHEHELALEIAHQVIFRDGAAEHEIRAGVSVDLGLLLLRFVILD